MRASNKDGLRGTLQDCTADVNSTSQEECVNLCGNSFNNALRMIQDELIARGLRAGSICKDRRISQSEIAKAVGASQAQVSRILAGNAQRKSRLFEEVCLFVEKLESGVTTDVVRANEELMEAVASVWDGSAQNARAISAVIRSLAALNKFDSARHAITGD